MKLKDLQDAMIAAMKAKDKPRKDSISALVSAVKKAGIDAGCRDDIPEDIVIQNWKRKTKKFRADPNGLPGFTFYKTIAYVYNMYYNCLIQKGDFMPYLVIRNGRSRRRRIRRIL